MWGTTAQAQIRRIVGPGGVQGNGDSYVSGWDPTGCCVLFYTDATNLFAKRDPNAATYIASANISTGVVTDLAVGTPTGLVGRVLFPCTLCLTRPEYTASRSALIFYAQAANGLVPGDTGTNMQVYLKTKATGAVTEITAPGGVPGNGDSLTPIIAANGAVAAFTTYATNLLPGVTYRTPALFTYTPASGALALAGVPANGVKSNGGIGTPSFSPDGTMLLWATNATNVVPMPAGSANIVMAPVTAAPGTVPTLISTTAAGVPGDGNSTHPIMSPSGRYVAFESDAPAFGGDGVTYQVYIKDLVSGALTLASTTASGVAGNGSTTHAQWSPDGKQLVMDSNAVNLTGANPTASTQIIVKNLMTGHVLCLSLNTSGVPGSGASTHPHFSPSGKYVAFAGRAPDLVTGDTNNRADVFIVPVPASY